MRKEAAVPGRSGAGDKGLKELKRIVSALQAGKLNERANAASFTGEWPERSRLSNSFAGGMNGLIGDMNAMSAAHDQGDIDAVIDAASIPAISADGLGHQHHGVRHIAVKKKAMACVAEIAKAIFEAPLERFPGKKAFINDNIRRCAQSEGCGRRHERHVRRRTTRAISMS